MRNRNKRTYDKKKSETKPLGMLTSLFFVAVLLALSGYVVSLITKEKRHRDRWDDYDDCGWA